jgi:choline-glycine betaine transporter
MKHSNRMFPYLVAAAAVAAVLIAVGAPLASLAPFAIVLLCPLMMVLMMRGMGGMASTHGREDHTGHGCEHDPTREAGSPTSYRH